MTVGVVCMRVPIGSTTNISYSCSQVVCHSIHDHPFFVSRIPVFPLLNGSCSRIVASVSDTLKRIVAAASDHANMVISVNLNYLMFSRAHKV